MLRSTRMIGIAALLLIVSGCASTTLQQPEQSQSQSSLPSWLPPSADREPFELDLEQINFVKDAVSSRLRDPESARFGDNIYGTRVVNDTSAPEAFCGSVNAKNAYGGYVGEVRFAVYQGDIFLPREQLSNEGLAVLRLCTT